MSCIYLSSLRGIRGRYSSSIRQMDKIKNTWRECELITEHVACLQCNFMEKGCVWLPPQACPGLMTLAPWCTTWWLRFPTRCYTWLTLLQHLSSQITEVSWAFLHRDRGRVVRVELSQSRRLICFPRLVFELVGQLPATSAGRCHAYWCNLRLRSPRSIAETWRMPG